MLDYTIPAKVIDKLSIFKWQKTFKNNKKWQKVW